MSPSSSRRLVAAFPATGKSYYAERHDNVADSDSSAFSWIGLGKRHPDWPHNYLRHIKDELLDGRTVLVSTHAEVRHLLEDEELPFTLVYPQRHLRDEYVRRMVDRGSSIALCETVAARWHDWITEMHEQPCAARIVLGAGDYLSDVMSL